ncbi:hypothetical protein H5410_006077, partial [Solanum commersonii]
MEYPTISQIMQHINQIMGLDPNPHPRDMMPNPEFIHQLTSSERMQVNDNLELKRVKVMSEICLEPVWIGFGLLAYKPK